MIDAGIGIRKIQRYLIESGISIANLAAIFLTHDHADHSRNVGTLQNAAKKKGSILPAYMTEKVIEGILENPTITKKPIHDWVHCINKDETVECCGCRITPFGVPHDSRDNVGFYIEHDSGRGLCIVTDAGEITEHILMYIQKATRLILESNYDNKMLEVGPYPEDLKRRIRGKLGHLCNDEAATIIYNGREHLKKVWLCHLSDHNNSPRRAFDIVSKQFEHNGFDMKDFMDLNVLLRKTPSTVFDL